MARFPPSILLAFFWSCPQAPYLVFFNYKLGSFCSRAGICGLLWDFTVLTSSVRFSVKYFTGNRRQFCNKGREAAHGRWTGIRGWAQIHRSWFCPHLPTTISLTKFTFSIFPYAKRKLLSVWVLLCELESHREAAGNTSAWVWLRSWWGQRKGVKAEISAIGYLLNFFFPSGNPPKGEWGSFPVTLLLSSFQFLLLIAGHFTFLFEYYFFFPLLSVSFRFFPFFFFWSCW